MDLLRPIRHLSSSLGRRHANDLSGRVRSRRGKQRFSRTRQPAIERLEDRTLLAAISWDGGAGTLNWFDANNWSNNTLPTSADDVTVDIVGSTATVTSTGTVSIKSLTLPSSETISVTAGSFTLGGNSSGTGTLRTAGGTVTINGTNWTNSQTIDVTSGTLNLGGSFTQASLGTFTRSGGTVRLTGTISGGLTLSDATGSWDFVGGTMSGGTLDVAPGSTTNPRLLGTNINSTLAGGVTVNAGLDMATNVSSVFVTGGLTLNQTLNLGNTAGTTYGLLPFNTTTQTLGGNGTIVFGGHANNYVYPFAAGQTLTIGPNITIRGKTGNVGNLSSATVINQGRIQADTAGGTVSINGPFSSSGAMDVTAGTLNMPSVNWSSTGTITLSAGTLNLNGSFTQAGMGTFVRSGGTVRLTGTITGGLTLSDTIGSWDFVGGTMSGGTLDVAPGSTTNPRLIGTNINSTLAGGVTVNAGLDMATNVSSVFVTGGLTLNQTLNLGNTAGTTYGLLPFNSTTQTLGGNGTIVFGGHSSNYVYPYQAGQTLTIGPNITIRGKSGNVGNSSAATVINQGLIHADTAGGTFTVTLGTNGQNQANTAQTGIRGSSGGSVSIPGTWTNAGQISMQDGGTLTLSSGANLWTSSGTISMTSSTVNLAGSFTQAGIMAPGTGTFTRSGGTVRLTGTITGGLTLSDTTGSWDFVGGTMSGGTLDVAPGSTTNPRLLGTSGTLAGGVTVNAGLDMATNVSSVFVTGGLTLNQTLNLGNTAGTTYGLLPFNSTTQTLGGNGTIVFGGHANNYVYPFNAGQTLTIGPNITIRGKTGNVGNLSSATVINQGRIQADTAGGTVSINGPFSSSGAIDVTAGTLTMPSVSWSSTGTITLSAGTLNLNGSFTQAGLGTFTHSGGTVRLTGTISGGLTLSDATGSWDFVGGTMSGGTLDVAPGSTTNPRLIGTNINSTLAGGVTVNAGLDMATNVSSVFVTGGLTLNQTLNLGNTAGTTYGLLPFNSTTQTLGGNGTIVFGGHSSNYVYPYQAGQTLTIGPNITIRGKSGNVGNSSAATVINQGLIHADTAGGTFTVTLGTNGQNQANTAQTGIRGSSGGSMSILGTWTNAGQISMQDGGTLTLSSGANLWTSSGTISMTSSTVNLAGSFTQAGIMAPGTGTFTRSGGTVRLTGTITGGLTLSDTTGSWDFVGGTMSGGTLDVAPGSTTNPRLLGTSGTLAGGVTVNAGLDMATNVSSVFVTGGLTLNQTLNLGNTAGTTYGLLPFNSTTQTLGGNGTIVFGGHSSNYVYPYQAGQTLTIGPNITIRGKSGNVGNLSTATVINQGLIHADTAGGTFTVTFGTTGSNSGTLQASGGTLNASPTTFTNFSSGTLTGGTYRVSGSSTMRLGIPSDIVTNAATIVIDGAGSNFYRGSAGTTTALGRLLTNQGSLTVSGGHVLLATLTNEVSLWSGEGTASDSVDGNNGTIQNATFTTGRVGQAFNFNGTNASVNLTETGLNAAQVTVAAWVKLAATQFGRDFIAKYAAPSGVQRGWELGIIDSPANTIKWFTGTDAGVTNTLLSTTTLQNDVWYHVAGTFDGTTKRLYVNGVQESSQTWANAIGYTSTVSSLGYRRATLTQFFNGQLDEAAVYSRALTAAEIAALASADSITQTAGTTSLGTGGILHGGIEVQGGSLVGSGTVRGDVENTATVAPGNSPGCITVNGNYNQPAAGDLNIEIAGLVPCTEHDKLIVNGTVTLGGDLNVSLLGGFVPDPGSEFTIIENDGTDPISGTFNGLPEARTITVTGSRFIISYIGGTGNDVVLTALPPGCTLVVTNTNDSGPDSLRTAIDDANLLPDADEICFVLPGTAPYTINVLSPLPAITQPLVIDGWSEPDFVSSPVIELDGSATTGPTADGLRVLAPSTIRGLAITGFGSNGIAILGAGASGSVVKSNYIGLRMDGVTAAGNDGHGIVIGGGATGVVIGGSGAAEGNVIAGHTSVLAAGVLIIDSGTTGNKVQGNRLGTNAAGTAAVGNQIGVWFYLGASANYTGTDGDGVGDAAEGNLIAGNSTGVYLQSNADDNVIAGNWIGLNATGTGAIPNTTGIRVFEDLTINDTRIGTNSDGVSDAEERNVISGNSGENVFNAGGIDTVIAGNYIGTNVAGAAAVGTSTYGVVISNGATGTRLGTNADGINDAAERNVIAGYTGYGVSIGNAGTTGNTVAGNYVGLSADGTSGISTGLFGVYISDAATGNTIGGTSDAAGNRIAFNLNDGVVLTTAAIADGTTVRRNSIHSNGGLGIDVLDDGVTPNDPGDTDGIDNFPIIRAAAASGGNLVITGFARPGTTFDLYAAAPDPTGFGEGQTYLTTLVEGHVDDPVDPNDVADLDSLTGSYGPTVNGLAVGSDTTSKFWFVLPLPAGVGVGTVLTAQTIGSTSEFSGNFTVGAIIPNVPPVVAAGSDVSFDEGTLFERDGAFQDFDSLSWEVFVDYGDGAGFEPIAFDPVEQTFHMSHLYRRGGQFTVVVRVFDDSLAFGSDSFAITVNNTPPVSGDNLLAIEPARIDENESTTITGYFTDDGLEDTHTVEVFWGDGTSSFAVVTQEFAAGEPTANRTYTASHQYLDDDPSGSSFDIYPITSLITDNGGDSDTTPRGLVLVQVDNVQPSGLTVLTNAPVVLGVPTNSEGDVTLLSGSFIDPGTRDTHRVVIDWGDESTDTILNLVAGVTTFDNVPHVYRDEPASPASTYTITVTVVDDDQPLEPITSTLPIAVENVTPTAFSLELIADTINEGQSVSLAASFFDPGELDPHKVVIDWGDGTANTVLDLGPLVASFTGVLHRYADDPIGTGSGSFTITVTVADTDEPLVTTQATESVFVNNLAPVVGTISVFEGLAASDGQINEGQTIEIRGSYTDVATDRPTLVVSWGDGTTSTPSVRWNAGVGSYTAKHTYRDDNPTGTASDPHTITVTATDDDIATGSNSTGITVNNVAPAVRIVPDLATPTTTTDVNLTSKVTDPGADDVLTYAWEAFKNGSSIGTGSGTSFSFSRAGAVATDTFAATLTVSDDDGGSTTRSMRVIVLTDAADTFTPAAGDQPAGVDLVMIFGLAGADTVDVSAWTIPVVIDGGCDNDTMTGGSADDTIVLRCGNDSAAGGSGADTYPTQFNSTQTITDFAGANVLDFSPTGFGVTFDLDQAMTTLGSCDPMILIDCQDVQPSNPGQHFADIDGTFAQLIGTSAGDSLTAGSNTTLLGGLGDDQLYAKVGTTNTTFSGGADADTLTTVGLGSVGEIDFSGDDGADTFINSAGVSAGTIIVDGGADVDTLLNLGSVGEIDFTGDDGADVFTNEAGGIVTGTIIVDGGADADVFENIGSAGSIDFSGDDGADTFINDATGSVGGAIIVDGGADADVFTNLGDAGSIDFSGDDGADTFTNAATGSAGTIIVDGGADIDALTNLGDAGSIDFSGDDGADVFTNEAGGVVTGTIIVDGGADADVFENRGSAGGIDFSGDDGADAFTNDAGGVVTGTIIVDGGADADVFENLGSAGGIDFSGDDGADTFTNEVGGVVTGTIIVDGGADADVFENLGSAGGIDFSGDDGADVFINNATGSAGGIIVNGGADADVFVNLGDAGSIDFSGDDGADVFINETGGTVGGAIIVDGGADADVFTNLGDAGSIDFTGDDGADVFVNLGSTGSIDFTGDDGADVFLNDNGGSVGGSIIVDGGADSDVFVNQGDAGSIDFSGDDGADVFINDASGSVGVGGSIIVDGGADADVFVNLGDAGSIDFSGDDGADIFINTDSGVGSIDVSGGADADWFRNDGSNIGSIRFFGGGSLAHPILFGDDGADVFLNNGDSIGTIIVDGGADIDAFQNNGDSIGSIDFSGDDGADVFINLGSGVGSIDFSGDDGADTFTNYGDWAGSIDFTGDFGNDVFVNHGDGLVVGGVRMTTITFLGQANDDAFQNNGVDFLTYVFVGDDGADVFQNNGVGVSGIDVSGGADVDVFENNGSGVSGIDFTGDDGADVFINDGAGTSGIIVDGGADADVFLNTGDGSSGIDFSGDDGADVFINTGDTVSGIDFTGDDGADVFINTGTGASDIIVTGGADGDFFRNRATGIGLANVTFYGGGSPTVPLVGDDGADVFVNEASGASGIDFSGDDGADVFQNTGDNVSGIDFSGDDGADVFINSGDGASQINVDGGADADVFQNTGDGVSGIDFSGDDGADVFTNAGAGASDIIVDGGADNDSVTNKGANVSDITFIGGPGDDRFQNNGAGTGVFTMIGDDGADAFENNASIGTIDFTGDAGSDFVINNASGVGQILVDGGAGPDWVLNVGENVGLINFIGGPDGDLLTNRGNNVTSIVFQGDSGADTFIGDGVGGPSSSINANSGDDGDVLVLRGSAATVQFSGGGGSDRLLISGGGSVNLDGGAGNDTYLFVGSPTAGVTIGETSSGAGDTSIDTFDFSSYTPSGGVAISIGSTAPQLVNAGAGLQLTIADPFGVENVIGTAAADSITGNNRPNQLIGADYPIAPLPPATGFNGSEQWVLLDFDSETNVAANAEYGEHEYTQAERDAIEANIEFDYHGPGGAANPWFHVRVTQDPAEIPAAVYAAGDYATIYFNRTPSFGRPGGESSELDFRNTNRSSSASVQVNGMAGAPGFPSITSENFVLLSSKIAAHELAHSMGVRHADAFGPIGFAVHTPPGSVRYNPSFPGPSAGFESFDHLIGSPATIGSDRFNDLRNLFFGEREAVKLAFNESGVVILEPAGLHGDFASAVPLNLATLDVPNTLSSGLNANKEFLVTAFDVVGTVGLAGAVSESDWYSFAGRAGDVVSIDVYSSGLSRLSELPNPTQQTTDSIIRVYRQTGAALELVPYFTGVAENDDQFEPTDSSLLDLVLPADGTYFIEVDTFERVGDPRCSPTDPESPLNPANPNNKLAFPDVVAQFNDSCADTDTGSYELFIYTFDTAHANPAADVIVDGPTVFVPADMTLEATGPDGAVATFTATATDSTGAPVPVTCVPTSGSTFPLGATTVTCSATDSEGREGSASFMVTVRDTTAPTVTMPADITREGDTLGGAAVTFTALAFDIVSGSVATVCMPLSGSVFAPGTTTVTCSATDAAGNTGSASFDVTVTDTVAPALTVPGDLTVEATSPAGAAVTFSATATDVVAGSFAAICTPASGSVFALGTTTVNCSATDTVGNSTSGSFTVTVQDTTGPVVTVPPNQTVEATSAAGAVVMFSVSAFDLVSGSVAVTCSATSGATFPFGTTTVNCSAADALGNSTSASFTVTVRDTTAPVVTVPGDITRDADTLGGTVVSFTASAFDIVDGSLTPTCAPPSGSTFGPGTTTVTCSATDAAGNTGSASFRVIVIDTIAPVVTVPANQTVEATSASGAVVTFSATASDLVSGSVATICVPASGSVFPLGTTTVNCSATDAAGNTGTASFTVTVEDTTAPVVSVPANQTIEATGATGAIVTFSASANDLVSGSVATICVLPSGSAFPFGTTTVNCSATDAAGNIGSASFTVTVEDTTAPLVTVPADIILEASGPAGAVATFFATALDIVDGPLTPSCVPASGSSFSLGTTTVTFSATDAAGNIGSANFAVTVRDTIAPVVTVPADITREGDTLGGAAVSFTATASDVVAGSITPICVPASGSVFAVGTTTVTCTATDASGNIDTASFTVTVTDTTAPVVSVPTDQTFEATSSAGAVATFTATAFDIVSGSLASICSPPSGSVFPIGTTTVNCSATDGVGNTGSASFNVTVRDTTAPVVTVPADITLEATGAAGAVVTFAASATDAVTSGLVTDCTPPSGSTFPLGATTVTCSATDAAGNIGSASFLVTVQDTTAPVVTVPADITREGDTLGGAAVSFMATASDIVIGSINPTCIPASGSVFPVGTTTVTCTATDASGNIGSASFTVTVTDTTAPVVSVPADQTVEATSSAGADVTFTATAFDIVSGSLATTCLPPSGSTFPLGTTTVNCSATDASGNTGSASFTITVRDTTNPVVTVPANMTVEATSAAGAIVTFSASATDLVSGSIVTICTPPSGSTFSFGTTAVNCSAADAAGNTGSASFTVTVRDSTAPVVTVPADITREGDTLGGAAVTFTATAFDVVDGSVPTICTPPSGSTFALGTTTVTCSATDAAGNTGSASFQVTVTDTIAPIVTVPANMTVESTGPAGAVVTFSASATDIVSGSVATICAPPSGSTFALGTTTVNCSATDTAGNTGSASFNVTVQDTTAPVVTVPANMTVEATSPAGAVVTFSATAADLVDGSVATICSPASGSTFPIATTTVTCSATDGAGNTGSASFTVTVRTTTPPVVTVPADITLEATGPAGAVATFSASATDALGGTLTATCVPASGSMFPIATTTVTCSATDGAGNTGSASFTVTVRTTTPPVVRVPADITLEATGPAGAVATFSASATDALGGTLTATCVPASGSMFPIATTTVTCSATDDAGNTGSASFTVTVRDTTAPLLNVPANMTVSATSGSGAVVNFVASATDVVNGVVAVTCAPPSGSNFPFGTTTVNCSATDSSNNTATASFQITVQGSRFITVLNPTAHGALTLIGGADIEVPGSVTVNSSSPAALIAIGHSSITAGSIQVRGGVLSLGSSTFSPAPVTGAAPASDPFATLPDPAAGTARGSVVCTGNSSMTLLPGVYYRVIAHGNCSLTFQPGQFVLKGGGLSVTGNASIAGSEVLVYNAGRNYPAAGGAMGKIVLVGSGSVEISPATSGTFAGVSIFQARDNTQPISLIGHATLDGGVGGTLYAPRAQLTIIGRGTTHATLVVDKLRMIGHGQASLTTDGSAADPETLDAIVSTGQLVTGLLSVSITSPDGTMTDDQLARIRDSIASINTTFGAYGVELVEVDAAGGEFADVRVTVAGTSPCGSQADGILGCTAADGTITLISGWDWFAGADAATIGGTQFDLQTIVTHEVGHVVGVQHSGDANSTMYSSLARGIARRNFTQADLDQLTVASDGDGPESLMSALRVNANGEISSAGNGHGTCPFCGARHAVSTAELEAHDIPALLVTSTADALPTSERFGAGTIDGRSGDTAAPFDVRSGLRSPVQIADPYQRGFGSHRDDVLLGGDGQDLIFGRSDDGTLHGPAGHDLLVGGFGADPIDRPSDHDAREVGDDSSLNFSRRSYDNDITDRAISDELDLLIATLGLSSTDFRFE